MNKTHLHIVSDNTAAPAEAAWSVEMLSYAEGPGGLVTLHNGNVVTLGAFLRVMADICARVAMHQEQARAQQSDAQASELPAFLPTA